MIADLAVRLARSEQGLPAYVYDLDGLADHAASIRASLPGISLLYAAKANPDPHLLRVLAPYVDGFEVASGGELLHVRSAVPSARIAFGGPGKSPPELALAQSVWRLHVESSRELTGDLAEGPGILLRVNLRVPVQGAALAMSGPFGLDPAGMDECASLLTRTPGPRLRGVHAHLASGLSAEALLGVAQAVLDWARPWCVRHGVEEPEFNLGGGMAVSYEDPTARFDWATFGRGLRALARPGETLRIEPGRALSAYCGWYLTRVLDIKRVHGALFAIVAGGTHHLRTPVTKGHDQPFDVVPRVSPTITDEPVTIVGQLCTPKDVLARNVPIAALGVGDVIAFSMAGAYAWNISHHDFLMHPRPSFHYVRASGTASISARRPSASSRSTGRTVSFDRT